MSRLRIPHRWRYPLAALGALAALAGAWRATQPPIPPPYTVLCIVPHPAANGGGGVVQYGCGTSLRYGRIAAVSLIFLQSSRTRTTVIMSVEPTIAFRPGGAYVACDIVGAEVAVTVQGTKPGYSAPILLPLRASLDGGSASITVPTVEAGRVLPVAVIVRPGQRAQMHDCQPATPARPASTFE